LYGIDRQSYLDRVRSAAAKSDRASCVAKS
jgi:hypothetical protein